MLGSRAERDGQGWHEHGGRGARAKSADLRGSLRAANARPETASVRLRQKIELVIRPMATAYEALVVHPRLPELWPEYLVMQHAIIRATVPLTEAALTRSRELEDTDSLAAPLSSYLAEHVD